MHTIFCRSWPHFNLKNPISEFRSITSIIRCSQIITDFIILSWNYVERFANCSMANHLILWLDARSILTFIKFIDHNSFHYLFHFTELPSCHLHNWIERNGHLFDDCTSFLACFWFRHFCTTLKRWLVLMKRCYILAWLIFN